MKQIKHYFNRRLFSAFIGTVLLLLAILLPPSTLAADSWWSKGLDTLRNFGSGSSEQVSIDSLSNGQISSALREALKVGARRVVAQLSAEDGFNTDPEVRIELPKSLLTIRSALARVGMESMMDDLELRINRAAEAATPIAQSLFIDAITDLTLEDVSTIYQGGDNAATEYFENSMSPELIAQMQPVIHDSLAKVGAIKMIDQIVSKYNSLPLVPKIDASVDGYVSEQAIEGIFHYMAQEEASIRQDPLARSTDLLKTVFGALD